MYDDRVSDEHCRWMLDEKVKRKYEFEQVRAMQRRDIQNDVQLLKKDLQEIMLELKRNRKRMEKFKVELDNFKRMKGIDTRRINKFLQANSESNEQSN